MRWGIGIALLAACVGLALPASAAAFGPLSSFGELGSGAGQLGSPAQLTVSPEGDLYVVDRGNDRVSVYAGDGSFLRALSGHMEEPEDVALDQRGRAFVADGGDNRIDVFSAEGSFLFSFGESGEGELKDPTGIAIDGSTVFVADSGNGRVAEFTLGGSFLSAIEAIPSASDVAVGDDGDLFVAALGEERIEVFSGDGTGPIQAFGEEELGAPVALVVDGTGEVFVVDAVAERVFRFGEGGGFRGSFDAAPNVAGVAVACMGNVFVTEADAQLARVVRFGEPGTPPPPCASAPPPVEPILTPVAKPPSNRFNFAGLRLNRGNGFATLYVRVPGPGSLKLTGRGFRRLSRGARQATTVTIPIKPKVRLRHFLKRHGKGRIRVEVTFAPVGGIPRKQEKVVVLRRHRG